jgi:hypothetical protein
MSSTYRAGTISHPIETGEDGAPAIGAPGRAFFSHKAPGELTQRTIADLDALKDFARSFGDTVAAAADDGGFGKNVGLPVIRACGMTRTSHATASNPLPPRAGFGTGEGPSGAVILKKAPHKMGDK